MRAPMFLFPLSAFSTEGKVIKVLCPDDDAITFVDLELRVRDLTAFKLYLDDSVVRREDAFSEFQTRETNIILLQHRDPVAADLRKSDYTYWFETPGHWSQMFLPAFCQPKSRIVLMPQGNDELERVTFDLAVACLQVFVVI